MAVIYYDPSKPADAQAPFRTGIAGRVELHADGMIRLEPVVELSPNSLHALWGHREVEALRRCAPDEMHLEPRVETLVPPTAIDACVHVLYQADRNTYGNAFEFVVAESNGDEFRLRVDNREYQRSLSRLQFLFTSSARSGLGIYLRL